MTTAWGVLCAAVARAQRAPHVSSAELTIALSLAGGARTSPPPAPAGPPPDEDDPVKGRITALVDLACKGDAEAFGQLYDHYLPGVFRFVYYRVSSRTLAEDLTSETFTRALRSIGKFRWQGKDFGAWLTTIARNLVADHFKSSRQRLEIVA
ncbi:MAG: sigma-70 family RNA polymerase sigma factor, partial [Nocardioidaceae bacterium]